MAPRGWAKKRFTVMPAEGEIIRLYYPVRQIPFPHGPNPPSTIAVSATTSANSTYSIISTRKPGWKTHHMLVLSASRDPTERVIKLDFMPIMAHSDAPPWYPTTAVWNSENWMNEEATDIKRLHHLPIPAVGWTPPPSLSTSAPILTFGVWLNTRPSWLALIPVSYDVPEIQPWYRVRKGAVILDGDLARLYTFIARDIPRALRDIQTAADAASVIPPDGTTATPEVSTPTPSIAAPAETSLFTDAAVNTVIIPDYYHVWAEFYGLENVSDSNLPEAISRLQAEYDQSSNDDLDSVMTSDCGMDPIFPGAPKGLLKIAQETAKQTLDNKILEWDTNAVGELGAEEDGNDVGGEDDEEDELDVAEIAFGEEAGGVS